MAFPVGAPSRFWKSDRERAPPTLISLGLQFLTIFDLAQKHPTMVNPRGSAAETAGAVRCAACSRHCAL
jgi:hypothetical protein